MQNYRVVRKKSGYTESSLKNKGNIDYTYSIHEAYYDINGNVGAITQNAIELFGETVDDLWHSWLIMAEAFSKPVLDYERIPEPGYERELVLKGSKLEKLVQDQELRNILGVP